jgi:hypothetical protein
MQLAQTLTFLKIYDEARTLLESTLAVAERHAGPRTNTALQIRHDLANVLRLMGDLAGGRNRSKSLLEDAAALFGPDHWQVALFRSSYASCLADELAWSDAERELRISLAMLDRPGVPRRTVRETAGKLALCLRELDKVEEALLLEKQWEVGP